MASLISSTDVKQFTIIISILYQFDFFSNLGFIIQEWVICNVIYKKLVKVMCCLYQDFFFFSFLWYKGGLIFIIWMFDNVILRESINNCIKNWNLVDSYCQKQLYKIRGVFGIYELGLSMFYLSSNLNFPDLYYSSFYVN